MVADKFVTTCLNGRFGRIPLNPVVRYVQGGVNVDALGLGVMQGDTLRLVINDRKKEEVPLPQAVRQFLDAFNRGKYPELELPRDET